METPVYRVGTLSYTKRALAMLFLWLLWGDFCFSLMEAIEPSVLPFTLKGLGASDQIISLYLIVITNIFNLTICPLSSFASDRFRSRWGRRIPFLAFATPFVALFLVLTGYCKEIGGLFFRFFLQQSGVSQAGVTIAVIAALVVGYQLFNMVVASVYYYLFNDVVPEQFLGRFTALFRAVGTAAGALFNYFVFPYAQTHGKEIFAGFGILYFVGFMMMCLMVKEGEYPPAPAIQGGKHPVAAAVKTFFKESYSHRFYWYFYMSFAFYTASWAITPFVNFRNLDIGLSMKEIGAINGVALVVTTILLVPGGYLVDKRHPIRVGMASMAWMLAFIPLNFIFLIDMEHGTALWLMILFTAITLPFNTVFMASELPMFMRLMPHTRYGQFSSANSIIRSAFMIACGFACGWFVQLTQVFCESALHRPGDYYYRLIFVWQIVFMAIALFFRVKLYRLWLRLGGDDGYAPPMFEAEEAELKALMYRPTDSHTI